MNIIIDDEGFAMPANQIVSPNQDERPEGIAIELIVIHNISLPPGIFGGSGIIDLFTNQLNPANHPYYQEIYQLRVSSHFLIRRDGTLFQFVSSNQRAWHAGVSQWQGREKCNDFSIGIELEGTDDNAFDPEQYQVLNALIAAIKNHYPIREIVGHSDIAPGRKTDPGLFFDWSQIDI